MAKKNYEFRPDKEGSGIIDKLYITKKQRMAATKWLLYGLVILILSVLQDVMLSQVSLFGATTDLVPCAILVVCVVEGVEPGSIFALVCAALYLFSGAAPGYHVIALIPFLGVVCSIFRQNYLRKGFGATFLCAGAAVMIYELVIFFVALFVKQTTFARLSIAAITGALDLAVIPILYPILASISKIGGETWKE